jgi:AcrR family transcriptional regulator
VRDGVTFRSVAQEAGVTHGLASYHFRTRDEMIGEAPTWATKHRVIPAVGAVVFLFPLWYAYNPLPDYPLRWAVWLAPAWQVAGVVVAFVLSARKPGAMDSARRVYVEQDLIHPGELEPAFVHPTTT